MIRDITIMAATLAILFGVAVTAIGFERSAKCDAQGTRYEGSRWGVLDGCTVLDRGRWVRVSVE